MKNTSLETEICDFHQCFNYFRPVRIPMKTKKIKANKEATSWSFHEKLKNVGLKENEFQQLEKNDTFCFL